MLVASTWASASQEKFPYLPRRNPIDGSHSLQPFLVFSQTPAYEIDVLDEFGIFLTFSSNSAGNGRDSSSIRWYDSRASPPRCWGFRFTGSVDATHEQIFEGCQRRLSVIGLEPKPAWSGSALPQNAYNQVGLSAAMKILQ